MERNEIVGNAVARTDRSALIKATRASDFPHQNIACASFVGDPEDSDILTKTLLASFVGVPGWQTNKNKRSKRHLRDQRAAAFFDILKLPLRGGSLPNQNGK